MLPIECGCSVNGNRAVLQLQADASLFWFQGHFPGLSVLPGVAQLDWVMHYATTLLATGKRFRAVENIKFQKPVAPNSRLQLELDWDEAKLRLSFRYILLSENGEQNASSGKVQLC